MYHHDGFQVVGTIVILICYVTPTVSTSTTGTSNSQNYDHHPILQQLPLLHSRGVGGGGLLGRGSKFGTTRSSTFSTIIPYSEFDQDPFHLDLTTTTTTATDSSTRSNENNRYMNRHQKLVSESLHLPSTSFTKNQQRGNIRTTDRIRCTLTDMNDEEYYSNCLSSDLNHHPSFSMDPIRIKELCTSTGTTIAGVCGHNFIVIGADSRSTANTMVADKQCDKIHTLASNVAAAGAGTAADLDHITRECYYSMKLNQIQQQQYGNENIINHSVDVSMTPNTLKERMKYNTQQQQPRTSKNMKEDHNKDWEQPVPVQRICRYLQNRLYEMNGSCQANLIVGGVDTCTSTSAVTKASLYAIHPHGSIDHVPYAALGSGGLAAMAVLESYYNNKQQQKYRNKKMSVSDAVKLVVRAISAGIINDLGSGSQVDIVVIGPNGKSKYKRNVYPEETLPPIIPPVVPYHHRNKNISSDDNDVPNTSMDPTSTNQGSDNVPSFSDNNSDSHDMNHSTIQQQYQTSQQQQRRRHVEPVKEGGVNGFGNTQYTIKSTRIIHPGYHQQRKDMKHLWKDVFDFSD